jgi:hypothetical protein
VEEAAGDGDEEGEATAVATGAEADGAPSGASALHALVTNSDNINAVARARRGRA